MTEHYIGPAPKNSELGITMVYEEQPKEEKKEEKSQENL